MERRGRFDFFVSYAGEDRAWAEWIAWQLEEAGFSTRLQHWDFLPGGRFPAEMHDALRSSDRMLAVLSPAYLESYFAEKEWEAIFAEGEAAEKKLVPVRVRDCEPEGLLRPIIWIDLVGVDEAEARALLLDSLRKKRLKPSAPPRFPVAGDPSISGPTPAFPITQAQRGVAPAATEADWTEAPWLALALGSETWIVEARDVELRFRRFGDHAAKRAARFESTISGLALSSRSGILALQTEEMVHVAPLNESGLVGAWRSAEVHGRSPRLLAVREESGGPQATVLMSDEMVFALDIGVGLQRRQEICAIPASCGTDFAGTFLIVSTSGRIIRGRNVLEDQAGWIDVDCAKGATTELIAGVRDEDGRAVLTAVLQDRSGSEAREVELPDNICRLGIVRTPSPQGQPSRLIVQNGDGDLAAWTWSDLSGANGGAR